MYRFAAVSLAALGLSACATTPASTPASVSAPLPAAQQPAPLTELVKAVDVPYESFTLDNGLTVLVHTDRKAPIVAASIWYRVGSKNEPQGKTGFAHLFEHLMFNGSENAPNDYQGPLQEAGAKEINGSTWFDRTNYYQIVPTGALDRALMLESDRMGHLLGAVTQEKLTNQIGVVQNEKRQGDNQSFGIVEYEQLENLYPSGHPYHHPAIGSMADLSGSTLEDVKNWFKDHYGPNNAVLVLAGDIDVPTARAKVTKWFGAIPAGPAVEPVSAPVPDLPAPLNKTIKDQIATARVYRQWAVPGLDNPDYLPLQIAASILGGLASSRLDDALVRQKQVAVAVSAYAQIFAQAGLFEVYADAKPGVDTATVGAAIDAEIARLMTDGPTEDELRRAVTVSAASQIRSLENASGKADALAESLLYNGDPRHFRVALDRAARLTPGDVRAAMQKWIGRPAFNLVVEPGERSAGGENRGGFVVSPGGTMTPSYYHDPLLAAQGIAPAAAVAEPDRSKIPAVEPQQPLDFPEIERATLSNGMKVYFARRAAVPTVTVRVSFDAGYSADPKDALGTQAMMLRLMNEGTEELNSSELARKRERLGAAINGSATTDNTSFQLDALTPNLAPSLELLADYIRRPAFDPAELERVRVQQLASIKSELNDPAQMALRVLLPAAYGPQHPYGIPPSGTGDPAVVARVGRADLIAFHHKWLRPDTASVFVVGDTTLAEATRLLEASFGDWQVPAEPAPVKSFAAPLPPQRDRIILVDRPNSPQSMIMGARVLAAKGTDDLVALRTANDILGGNFLGRVNTNLRETKGWSYGSFSLLSSVKNQITFRLYAPVQADQTGPAIAEFRKDLHAFVTARGVTDAERNWSTGGSARELPGMFETSAELLGGMFNIVNLGRPDNFYETLGKRYQALTAAELDAAARKERLGDGMVYVVVGDRKMVEPQLRKLGLPIEIATPVDSGAATGK